jgi:anti-sigma-K factor RskA
VNTKEYIESGKLENYVLGICTPEEKQEAECMARIFPEVRAELDSISASMEQYILANKVEPPESLKSKIFDEIEKEEKSSASTGAKVLQMKTQPKGEAGFGLKMLLAASIALVLISSFIAYNQWQQKGSLISEINSLKEGQAATNEKYGELNNRFAKTNEQLAIISNPNATHVVMKGTAVSPQSVATVYWNKESKEVYIAVNSLPTPPTDKQYQLWGIVNGKPVDLGVFNLLSPSDSMLQKMKSVEGATTFAVTLEKTGGSPVPTLDQMYVAGNL